MLNWKRMVTAVNQAETAVNKLRPADAYMRQRTGWTLVQVMVACRRTGDIQLSEQMVMNLMFLYGTTLDFNLLYTLLQIWSTPNCYILCVLFCTPKCVQGNMSMNWLDGIRQRLFVGCRHKAERVSIGDLCAKSDTLVCLNGFCYHSGWTAQSNVFVRSITIRDRFSGAAFTDMV